MIPTMNPKDSIPSAGKPSDAQAIRRSFQPSAAQLKYDNQFVLSLSRADAALSELWISRHLPNPHPDCPLRPARSSVVLRTKDESQPVRSLIDEMNSQKRNDDAGGCVIRGGDEWYGSVTQALSSGRSERSMRG
jgi:hypothetical protein